MAAAIIFLGSKLCNLLRRKFPQINSNNLARFSNVFGLHPPPVPHCVLDNDLMSIYEEILIIGDVHGCFDELKELLEMTKSKNSSKILKIFVGDLINKGPKNEQVLALVQTMPSTMSVRGNHDECVLKIYNDSLNPDNTVLPKNQWITKLSSKDIDYLNSLPYTVKIPQLNSVIVHAGLVPGLPLEANSTKDMVTMRRVIIRDHFEGGLVATKDNDKGVQWAEAWNGPYHVYFGHDAAKGLQKYKYATGLDTGCVYGKKLTAIFIYGPRKGQFVEVPAKETYQKIPK